MLALFRRTTVCRLYSTAAPYIPPTSLDQAHFDSKPRSRTTHKANPDSPTFYTGRSGYYDQIVQLETAVNHSRQSLKQLYLLPLPAFARAALPPLQAVWKNKDDMSPVFNARLTTSRYRRVTTLLNELNDYARIATTAGCGELSSGIHNVLMLFEKGDRADILKRGKRKPVVLDEVGRSYTVGRRKTSSARVWMIRTKTPAAIVPPPPPPTTTEADAERDLLLGETVSIPTSSPTLDSIATPMTVPTTEILVNNLPLSTYFPIPADRARITRPFILTGLLGAFNVFALVRGGGMSGQSGAVMQGIAKGIEAHEGGENSYVGKILKRSKVVRRDPRMVERKKTGLAKARKRYAWVKR